MNDAQLLAEHFSPLQSVPDLVHGFTLRVPGLEMSHDKTEALARLHSIHEEILRNHNLTAMPFMTARQVHGNQIALIGPGTLAENCFANCDGMVTDQPGVSLGIYVADCCAVYLVDPVRRAIGLVHSGKKGTELGIASRAIETMVAQFGSRPSDLIVQLSPCIRPPHYEIDFAAEIVRQCREAGVTGVHDCGICTACDLARYYSYRAEKGRTGRMLAFLALGAT